MVFDGNSTTISILLEARTIVVLLFNDRGDVIQTLFNEVFICNLGNGEKRLVLLIYLGIDGF